MPPRRFIADAGLWRSQDFDPATGKQVGDPRGNPLKGVRFPDYSGLPLGYPGGPCHVYERIRDRVPRGQQQAIIDRVESGDYNLPSEMEGAMYHQLYDDTKTGGPFAFVAISPHAQFRLDLRKVTLAEVRKAIMAFGEKWNVEKSRNSAWYQEKLEFARRGTSWNWEAPGTDFRLPIIVGKSDRFPGKQGVLIVSAITYNQRRNKPPPTPESSCENFEGWASPEGDYDWAGRVASYMRQALKIALTPGVTTFVREDSRDNLPTNLDRTKEQALPLPGSATPGGAGRDIPTFSMNGPDSESNIQPRTTGLPGEQYGTPTKYDYNMPTRRSMTARVVARYLGRR